MCNCWGWRHRRPAPSSRIAAPGEGAPERVAGRDLDVLEAIIEANGGEGIDGLAEGEVEAVVLLIVDAGDVVCVAVEELAAEGELIIEEVRLGDGKVGILTLSAELDAGVEALAAAGKGGPVKEVEVGLLDLDEA